LARDRLSSASDVKYPAAAPVRATETTSSSSPLSDGTAAYHQIELATYDATADARVA
tara:strand:- start:273 stop:443 length:171 start_codon:yes stop_codon:yes gene_type:complete